MKKLVYLSAAALALTACVMETEQIPATGNVETITFEAEASTQTKTTLVDGTKVYWCAGDQISLSGAAAPFTNSLTEGETAAKTAFTGDVATADKYYAVYPASAVQSWSGAVASLYDDAKYLMVTMRQHAVKGTFANGVNITAANTTSQDKSFSFKNMFGYVKVGLPDGIKTVNVTANGGENIWGKFNIDCEVPALYVVEGSGSNCVSLFDYTEIAAGEYYIALVPGTYTEGLTFDFVGTDGKVATKTISASVELEAGHVSTIGKVSGLEWTDPAAGIENVIWKGKYVTGKWDAGMSDLTGSYFDWSAAKAGDVLKVYGGTTNPDVQAVLGLKNSYWGSLAGTQDVYNVSNAETSVVLTEDAIAELKNGGLIVQGDNYYLSAIALVPGTGAGEEPGQGDENGPKLLWEGEFVVTGWNGMDKLSWGGHDWSTCKPGNVLRIDGIVPTADWWCISLRVGEGWTNLKGVPAQYDKPGIVYVELTQETIDDLVARGGLVIQGDGGYTLTKIRLYEDMPEEICVWEGEYNCGTSYSGGLQNTIGEVAYGTVLHIGYETPAEVGDGYYQIKLCYVGADWSWNAMSSTESDVNEYGFITLDTNANEYTVSLTDSDVDAINAGQKAIVVQGYAATITKVSYTVE